MHVLVWLDERGSRLGKSALQLVDEELGAGKLSVSAISFLGNFHADKKILDWKDLSLKFDAQR